MTINKPLMRIVLLLGCLLVVTPQPSFGIVINFDSLVDLEGVTNQFAAQGVRFTNATVLTAGISLNELEFPPQSGDKVVFDDGGPITVTFDPIPFLEVGGFFTHTVPITLSAFDPLGNLLAEVSNLGSNLGLSGDPGSSPNEFLGISGLGPIGSLQIAGDLVVGGSFTLDDFTGTPQRAVTIPATLFLLGSSLAGLSGYRAFQSLRHKV